MKDILYFNTVEDIRLIDMLRIQKEHDYSKDYLTFEALEDGTFTFTKAYYSMYGATDYLTTEDFTNIGYSLDNGNTWTMLTNSGIAEEQTITTPTISMGEKVIWKGISQYHGISGASTVNCTFSSTSKYKISGNIMSILYGDNFNNSIMLPQPYTSGSRRKCTLGRIFGGNTKLTSAENLILPATTLAESCYSSMFQGCTSLTTAPELPATTLANACYQTMFNGCTSLTTAPVLPATTLASSCYASMFSGCTSLITTPELPATTLAKNCYASMFDGCTSLTTAPELPATTLANNCYASMFYGCRALTTAPELPATTLADNCYQYMFKDCTSLTTAPVLPATTLAKSCYNYMFSGCSRLNYIKAMFTTTPSTSYTNNWVSGVAATGTFVKNSAAEWDVSGDNGIPSGWTVETADS